MDASPHPLVVRLVHQLLKRRVNSYDDAAKMSLAQKLGTAPDEEMITALEEAGELAPEQVTALDNAINAVLDKQPFQLSAEERSRLARAADIADIPEIVTIAGYLGGTVDVQLRGRYAKWWILYIDSQLQNWRLIPDEDILLHNSMNDDQAPFNKRDLIWVDADALTARGEAPPRPEAQAQYLRGDFTRAGDLAAPAPGGPSSPSTGVFCDATTPSCCTRTVRP